MISIYIFLNMKKLLRVLQLPLSPVSPKMGSGKMSRDTWQGFV